MKTISLFIAAFLLIAVSASAQDEAAAEEESSQTPKEVLPATGDYAISFDAAPLFNYALNVVNIANNTGDRAQHPGYVNGLNQALSGKYFIDKNTAYRVTFAINNHSEDSTNYFDHPYKSSEYKNVTKQRWMNIALGAGMEKRRGYGNLQGYYGGEALIGLSTGSRRNPTFIKEYGLDMDSATVADGEVDDPRTLENKQGLGFSVGVRGFVGVEYFFLPKMSLGAEFGWGFMYQVTSPRGSVKTETWNAAEQEAEINESDGSTRQRESGFSVDQGLMNGGSAGLKLTVHF